jgi:hypothetical protein
MAVLTDGILFEDYQALRIVKCSYAVYANLLLGGWHGNNGSTR